MGEVKPDLISTDPYGWHHNPENPETLLRLEEDRNTPSLCFSTPSLCFSTSSLCFST